MRTRHQEEARPAALGDNDRRRLKTCRARMERSLSGSRVTPEAAVEIRRDLAVVAAGDAERAR